MDFKVVFKDTFIEDLAQIVGQIAAHDASAGQNFGENIIKTAESLSFFPSVTRTSVSVRASGDSS